MGWILPVVVLVGLALQFLLGILLLKLPGSRTFFAWLNHMVGFLEEATRAGTGFSVCLRVLRSSRLP